MATTDLKCEVCGKPAIGVACALGPMSSAFCGECVAAGRVTYGNLVGYLCGLAPFTTLGELPEHVRHTVHATLTFYNKTFDDFVKDCNQALRELEELDGALENWEIVE